MNNTLRKLRSYVMMTKDLMFAVLMVWVITMTTGVLLIQDIKVQVGKINPTITETDNCFVRSTQGGQKVYHPIKCPWGKK